MDRDQSKKHTKKAERPAEGSVQRLMRKLGSLRGQTPIFDAVPPAHTDAQTLEIEVLTIRLRRAWAWMIAHTTRLGSEHAVDKNRKDLSLADLAKDLGLDISNAGKVWAQGEELGLFRRESAYAGRLYITGTAVGCLPDPNSSSPLFATKDVVCTNQFFADVLELVSKEEIEAAEPYLKKDYIRRQLFGKPPAERAAAVKSLAQLNTWGMRVAADAMALVRQAVDEEEAAILAGIGVDRPKGKPRRTEPASSLRIQLLRRSHGAAPPAIDPSPVPAPLQVVPPPAKPQTAPEPAAEAASAPRTTDSLRTVPEADVAQVFDALRGLAGGNRTAARQLLQKCRANDPRCTAVHVVEVLDTRKEAARGKANPIGWLMTYVPQAFEGGYQPTVVQRKKNKHEIWADEQRRKEALRQKEASR